MLKGCLAPECGRGERVKELRGLCHSKKIGTGCLHKWPGACLRSKRFPQFRDHVAPEFQREIGRDIWSGNSLAAHIRAWLMPEVIRHLGIYTGTTVQGSYWERELSAEKREQGGVQFDGALEGKKGEVSNRHESWQERGGRKESDVTTHTFCARLIRSFGDPAS